ncbi:Arrestin domain-containing protein 3 [Chionoecetes opilio]|uniref:Arrestin domain-containing protein 3 n=1 Tax=Chionoecetes opilio TaxID=41210 RepID=A0A8J4YCK7_CHIOP|nr:Arrestin domain-containing protein 3 [Chionoecetes opilio]
MGVKLEVVLDPEQPSYTNGQEVTGWVKVTADAVTACKAVLARARGVAEVGWAEDGEDTVSDSETFFDNTVTVWAGASYGENFMPGEFSLPFSFRLPDHLPPTYEGQHGHIRYSVEAQNEVQWGAVSNALARFKVTPIHDLNADPKIAEMLPLRKEENYCCWCCEEGPVIVSLTAEKGGYVAGEYVLLTGEITNKTSKVVEEAVISLHQTITFHASGSSKNVKTKLQEVKRPGMSEGATDVWLSVPIHIPDYAVSLDHCNIITVEYKIKVSFVTVPEVTFVTVPQVSFLVAGYWSVDADNTFKIGTVPVGKPAFTLEGAVSNSLSPSAPPLDPHPPPVIEQPRPLGPLPPLGLGDPVLEGREGEGGHNLTVL